MSDELELQQWAMDLVDQAVTRGDLEMTTEGLNVPAAVDVDAELDKLREEKKLAAVDGDDDVHPQEQIILGFALEGDKDRSARWAAFRQAIGLKPDMEVPDWLWTDALHMRIAKEIDLVFRGERGDVRKINGKALIAGFGERLENDQVVGSFQAFVQTITGLTQAAENLGQNDFDIATDLLKSRTARTMLQDSIKRVERDLKADLPVEKVVQHLVGQAGEAMSLIRGRLRGDESFKTPEAMWDDLESGMSAEKGRVISTGVRAMDIDLQGGVNPLDTGKLNVIGARTRVGKTTLGVAAGMGLCMNGAHVLFISCELSDREVMARAMAHYSYRRKISIPSWKIEGRARNKDLPQNWQALKDSWANDQQDPDFGSFTVKGDFQATAEIMGEYIYAAKAQNPELSAVFIDHFHIMSAMKGYSNRSGEMEARALYLHQVGKACEVDLFVMAQLNRDACNFEVPGLEHINGTDVLAQLATAVWLLEFPKKDDDGNRPAGGLNIHHAKFRNGQRETIDGYHHNRADSFINEETTQVSVDREHCYFTDGTEV